jgi:hypothetical protein
LQRYRPSSPTLPVGAPAQLAHLDFDALAQDLADGLSRREALHRLGTGLAAAIVGSLGLASTVAAQTSCPTGQTNCSGVCVDTRTNLNNCGACGNVSPARPNATPVCNQGVPGYLCNPGFADCDASAANGCETVLEKDPQNCGACGYACRYSETCVDGKCISGSAGDDCPTGETWCYGFCADLTSDINNCGACGQVCSAANAAPLCQREKCLVDHCFSGFADCDGDPTNGCETDIQNDPNNCGACGYVCPSPTPVCHQGSCTMTEFDKCQANCRAIQRRDNDACQAQYRQCVSACGQNVGCQDACQDPFLSCLWVANSWEYNCGSRCYALLGL